MYNGTCLKRSLWGGGGGEGKRVPLALKWYKVNAGRTRASFPSKVCFDTDSDFFV